MQDQQRTLSDKIQAFNGGVISNPYQGADKKVLFVCSMGILRSATAARIYASKYNTRCAGTLKEALIPLTELLIDWADEIVFVKRENYNSAVFQFDEQDFYYKSKILDISDDYEHMRPELVAEFMLQYEVVTIKNTLT